MARAVQGLDVELTMIDVDGGVDTAEQHGVHAVPTFIRVQRGVVTGRMDGAPAVAALREFIRGVERRGPSLPSE